MTFQTEKYYVYTLFSLKDKKFYTGFTSDLRNRLSQHARGEVKSTINRRPLRLIHYEYFIDEVDARAREVFLKSGFGRNNMKKALQRTLSEFQERQKQHESHYEIKINCSQPLQ
jgi:putative endonuclease